jgi:hypothetical protein
MRAQGVLAAKEETVKVFDSLRWTQAQKQLVDHYEPGMQLRFVKRTNDFEPGETAEVVQVVGKQLKLRRNSDGKMAPGTAWAPSRSPSSFEVGEAREINLAPGDWLLLQANAHNFINGERVRIKSMEQGKIALRDGRVLPDDYRTFTHGYAVTSHAAQGKTVDQVFVVASSRSFAAVSQEQFYVSISRAKERAQVFTDDASLLARRVADSHTRKAALELQGLREALAAHGLFKANVSKERLKEETRKKVVIAEGRAWRSLRAFRSVRLSPMQQILHLGHSFKAWFKAQLSVRLEPSQAVRTTLREGRALRNDLPLPVNRQSHSRGMHL